MASIFNAYLNLDKIEKSKIIKGKKGNYLPISGVLNDEIDQFGYQGSITIGQSKEERATKDKKVYLSNIKVAWTNGINVPAAPREDNQSSGDDTVGHRPPGIVPQVEEDDLPF